VQGCKSKREPVFRSRRSTQESAHAHKTSNAKDFAFVAHKIKGSYDQRAVGHEARQSGFQASSRRTHMRVSTKESAQEHKNENRVQVLRLSRIRGLRPVFQPIVIFSYKCKIFCTN
jgi:hypothetical protein